MMNGMMMMIQNEARAVSIVTKLSKYFLFVALFLQSDAQQALKMQTRTRNSLLVFIHGPYLAKLASNI